MYIADSFTRPEADRRVRRVGRRLARQMVEQALARGHEACSRGPARGSIRAGVLGRDKMGSSIARADSAIFLLNRLTTRA